MYLVNYYPHIIIYNFASYFKGKFNRSTFNVDQPIIL